MSEQVVRSARNAALGDSMRLAIVDELVGSDRSPVELRRLLGIESNLMAHHLDVLEGVGMIARTRSSGDGRRRYIHLVRASLVDLVPGGRLPPTRALFVCTRNSARSPLAATLWRSMTGATAESAGTHPAARVHPGAVAAAARAGLEMSAAVPRSLDDVGRRPPLVVTVCDQAHEELDGDDGWLHWSVPDPVTDGRRAAFDRTVTELRERITSITSTVAAERR